MSIDRLMFCRRSYGLHTARRSHIWYKWDVPPLGRSAITMNGRGSTKTGATLLKGENRSYGIVAGKSHKIKIYVIEDVEGTASKGDSQYPVDDKPQAPVVCAISWIHLAGNIAHTQ